MRTLTLTQLQHFAKRGSRRAKAEIERRMMAADETPARTPAAPRSTPLPPVPPVPGEIALSSVPRRARPTVPGELAPRPRPAPTVPGDLTPRPRPAPTVPGDLTPSSMPRHGRPTVPGGLTPRPAPARQSVDVDIGSSAAPVRRFTSAPFPSTEMLGDLLPLADSPTHPHTNAYSIEVRPGDMPLAEPQPQPPAPTADVPPLPHSVARSPVFPTTEVLDESQKPSAASNARKLPPPAFVVSRAPSSFDESHAPSSFSESRAPSSFSESRGGEEPHQRRKAKRPEGVPSRPMPLHVPDSTPSQAPANALDSQQERMAEHLA
ncbi:MAG: hypothetical protein J6T92_01410, partial [Ottowia sp.]|nr:hypothetical protein [Ottowia sp.]